MIKKVLIFVVMVVGGFFALNALVDDGKPAGSSASGDPAAGSPAQTDGGKTKRSTGPGTGSPEQKTVESTAPIPRPQGPGIRIENGNKGSTIRTDYRGAWNFAEFKEIELPNGDKTRFAPYQIKAEDSHTETNNRLVLEGVTVDFYDLDDSDKNNPRRFKTGTMIAGRARLAFSQGEDKVIRPAEDKQMELWDVVYTSVARRSVAQLTIKMAEARILNRPEEMRLWTSSEFEPVEIIVGGPDGFRVTGKGLRAAIPTHRNKKGKVQAANSGTSSAIIFHDPRLTHQRMLMSSKGELRILGNEQLGSALVTMTDQVRLESLQRTRSPGRGAGRSTDKQAIKITARGDFLRAYLARSQVDGKDQTIWTRIHLSGNPAHLGDGEQVDLTSATINVLPDAEGEPYWFTAAGSGALTPKMSFTQKGLTHNFESSGRVHVIRVRRVHDLLMRSYGFPMQGIPTQFDQVVVFEGRTVVSSPSEGLTLLASEGLTLVRSELPELRDSFLMRGRGDVDISAITPKTSKATGPRKSSSRVRGSFRALGNNGFTLRQSLATPVAREGRKEDAESVIIRHIQIGPSRQDATHRYDVRYETQNRLLDKVHVIGTGTCSFRMRGAMIEQLRLRSPSDDIEVEMSDSGNRLSQVGSVLAWFGSDNQVDRFIGKGIECRMTMETKHGKVHGKAQEIHQLERDVYRLEGQLAEIREPSRGILRGRIIHLRKLSDEDFQMRATRDAFLQFTEEKPGKIKGSSSRTTAHLYADEIRVDPFLLPPSTARLYEDLLPATLRLGLDTRHLFAKGRVRFDYEIVKTPSGSVDRGACRGTSLKIRTDRTGRIFSDGYIVGSPARFDSLDGRNRHTVARSDRIRFFVRKGEQFLTLERIGDRKPSIEWVGDLRAQPAAARATASSVPQPTTRLTCEGPIRVEPTRILYGGAVRARSYDARGQLDPTGLSLDTKKLVIDRTADGLLDKIRADQDVVFQWSGTQGTCDSLTLDITNLTMKAKGRTNKPAVIQLPNSVLTVDEVHYDYRTKMSAVWLAGIKQPVLTSK